MKKIYIILIYLGFVSYSCSQGKKNNGRVEEKQLIEDTSLTRPQEKIFFGIKKYNQSIYEDKEHRYVLSPNNYYNRFDGCDIFVDNLYRNGFDSPGINAVFLIEPSLSYYIEKSINDFDVKRAVIMISLMCKEDDSIASIRINQISLRNIDNTEYENINFANQLEEFVKNNRTRVLLRNSNRLSYSCGLLFVRKKE